MHDVLRPAVRASARRAAAPTRATWRRPRTWRWAARRPSAWRRRTARPRAVVSFPDGATLAPVRVRVAVERRDRRSRDGRADARRRRGRAGAARRHRPGRVRAAAAGTTGRWRTGRASRCAPTSRRAFDRMAAAARRDGVALVIASALPLRRGAGRPVRPPPGPEVGRAAGRVAAPQRDRARPRPDARRIRGWRRTPAGSTSSCATRGNRGISATSSTRARRRGTAARAAAASDGDGRAGGGLPGLRPGALRARAQPRGAALERVGHAARRPAVRGERVQPVRGQPGRRAGHRAVHARHRARHGTAPIRSTPTAAIDAQAHLMRDLLRQFGAVPLALAAYNAGPAPVSACGCVPAYPGDARLRRADPRADVRRGGARRRRRRRPASTSGSWNDRAAAAECSYRVARFAI